MEDLNINRAQHDEENQKWEQYEQRKKGKRRISSQDHRLGGRRVGVKQKKKKRESSPD